MASATTSDYLYDKQMEYLLKAVSWTPAASIWVALFVTAPALDGTGGTEVLTTGGTNYARVEIVSNGSNWAGPSGANREYSNVNSVDYLAPGANWGTITSAGLYDASAAGNLLFVATLTTSKTVSAGDGAPKILAGQLRITRAVCP